MTDALIDLPAVLAADARFAALAQMWGSRLAAIDPQDVIVRWIDHVDASLLPILAEEYSLLDDGWELADTESKQRALLKLSSQLHRRKGTPWAVKTALATIGYPVLDLIEQRASHDAWVAAGGLTLNGDWLTDGHSTLDPPASIGPLVRHARLNHWAEYSIRLNVADGEWTREQQRRIRATAERYAPARSRLVALITAVRLAFDARIRLTGYRGRVHTRLDRCRRLSAHNRTTLDGCWLLDGDDAPLMLAGWPLDGRRLHGRTPTGRPLNAGAMSLRTRLRQRIRSSLGGSRTRTVTLGGRFARLNGRARLSESTLGGGWTLASGRSLGDSTLDRIAAPRLDGTWLLGGETGQPGLWFTGTLTIRRNGITTTEAI